MSDPSKLLSGLQDLIKNKAAEETKISSKWNSHFNAGGIIYGNFIASVHDYISMSIFSHALSNGLSAFENYFILRKSNNLEALKEKAKEFGKLVYSKKQSDNRYFYVFSSDNCVLTIDRQGGATGIVYLNCYTLDEAIMNKIVETFNDEEKVEVIEEMKKE